MNGIRFIGALAIAGGVLLVGVGISSAQSTGPISAATAKAENAITRSQSACLSVCKARGNVKPASACANWCEPGQCYRSLYEAYCIK